MRRTSRITRNTAESLAIQALAYLAEEPERLGIFLAASGVEPDTIRQAAADPAFLAGVLDHVASSEELVLAFAAQADIAPEDVERARAALGGVWERETP